MEWVRVEAEGSKAMQDDCRNNVHSLPRNREQSIYTRRTETNGLLSRGERR